MQWNSSHVDADYHLVYSVIFSILLLLIFSFFDVMNKLVGTSMLWKMKIKTKTKTKERSLCVLCTACVWMFRCREEFSLGIFYFVMSIAIKRAISITLKIVWRARISISICAKFFSCPSLQFKYKVTIVILVRRVARFLANLHVSMCQCTNLKW